MEQRKRREKKRGKKGGRKPSPGFDLDFLAILLRLSLYYFPGRLQLMTYILTLFFFMNKMFTLCSLLFMLDLFIVTMKTNHTKNNNLSEFQMYESD